MTSKIGSKGQFIELCERGAFGNTFRFWRGAGEFSKVARSLECLVTVRCLGEPGMPYMPRAHPMEALWFGEQFERVHKCEALFHEASPDHMIVLQGEYCEAAHGSMLEWSRSKTDMRAALAEEHNVLFGPGARLLLKRVMWPASYDDLLALGETYPEAVIEFTVYSQCVGSLRGRNHCIWEVRNY